MSSEPRSASVVLLVDSKTRDLPVATLIAHHLRMQGITAWLEPLEAYQGVLAAHRPELIFISAGFDAHREDDMGQLGLVEHDYAWITRQLMDVAEIHSRGRIVSCLEGGYHLSALARSVSAHLRVLADLG